MTQQEKSELQTQKIIAGLKLSLERLLVYKKQKNVYLFQSFCCMNVKRKLIGIPRKSIVLP
jgi:hypothetical protein